MSLPSPACGSNAAPTPDSPFDQGRAAYYGDVLQELTELGMGLARAVAAAPGEGVPSAETLAAFDRVSRTVRRTVRLAHFIASPPRAVRAEPGVPGARAPERAAPCSYSLVRMPDIMLDRLESPEVLEAFEGGRAADDIIKEVSRELGLTKRETFWRRRPGEMPALHIEGSERGDEDWLGQEEDTS